jgi:hypothetical protein
VSRGNGDSRDLDGSDWDGGDLLASKRDKKNQADPQHRDRCRDTGPRQNPCHRRIARRRLPAAVRPIIVVVVVVEFVAAAPRSDMVGLVVRACRTPGRARRGARRRDSSGPGRWCGQDAGGLPAMRTTNRLARRVIRGVGFLPAS